jgi:hypothetical protein
MVITFPRAAGIAMVRKPGALNLEARGKFMDFVIP